MGDTIWGESIYFQVVDDRILIEAPSSTMLWCMFLTVTHTYIWKGTLEWRWDFVKLLPSKEITSVLGENFVKIDKISPFLEQSKPSMKLQ